MKKNRFLLAFLVFTAISPAGFSADAPAAAVPTAGSNQRVLRSGDTLNITVWQHKDLSTTVLVDEAGNIDYLFLGIIPVAGKTVPQVKDVLKNGISENYIVDPKIDITVDKKSLTFFITGEVLKPGTYEFRPGITVLEAVAIAGGWTDYASRKVKIIRKGEGNAEKEIKVNTKKLLKATDQRDEAKIYVDDILVAERSWW